MNMFTTKQPGEGVWWLSYANINCGSLSLSDQLIEVSVFCRELRGLVSVP